MYPSSGSMRNCADAGIAPQALQQSGNTPKSVPYHYSSFDGERVNYSQVNERMHRVNRFPSDGKKWETGLESYPGLYDSGLVCSKGISNIDNQCLCPGSGDSMPYVYQPPQTTAAVTNLLFSPFLPGAVPELTPAAQQLVAERAQLPRGVGSYYQLDAPLSCGEAGGRQDIP